MTPGGVFRCSSRRYVALSRVRLYLMDAAYTNDENNLPKHGSLSYLQVCVTVACDGLSVHFRVLGVSITRLVTGLMAYVARD